MAEARIHNVARWGEELRRLRFERRRCRRALVLAAAAASLTTAALASLAWPPEPLLVWNASASSPEGLYLVRPASDIAAGDMAVAWPPAFAARLAADRGYLPAGVPLVKSVAAAQGDRVCAIGEAVFVNAALVTRRHRIDRSDRPLPWWTGCRTLRSGEILLLSREAPDAFDGRYFGVTHPDQVVGKARLL